ncbi:MAG: HupE/UreJ family protein [Rhizobiaceae bacterium]
MKLKIVIIALIVSFVSMSAQAHFKLNQNVRIYHVIHTDLGMDIYLRAPMAYLVAGLVGPQNSDGLAEPAPYTYNRKENGALMHYLAQDMLQENPEGLGKIAGAALSVEVDAGMLRPQVTGLRAYPIGYQPKFATRSEAISVFDTNETYPPGIGETYVGDTIVDVHLHFKTGPVSSYQISNSANPNLPGQDQTANLIIDYRGEDVRTFRSTGLMDTPVRISRSASAAALSFLVEGINHIFGGLDHVLFVLCMIIGAHQLRGLLGRVTGFTVGHTVTLILGFFGVAPTGAWFIPTIELAIALSIIYAAAMVVLRPVETLGDERRAIAITTGIGLLHGFGFSFMLRQILEVDAPNVWQSLLAFNIGVEVGQIAIVLLAWPIVLTLRNMPDVVWVRARAVLAISAVLIAADWAVERVDAFL